MSSERCARCGSVGSDRRILKMACFYAMEELDIPFEKEVLFHTDLESLKKNREPVTLPQHGITIAPGTFTTDGELTSHLLYSLRVCKRCRGEWMAAIKQWFETMPDGEDHDADDYQSGSGCGSGIFIRENGAIREITRAQWDRRNPGRKPVVFRPNEEETR